MNLEASGAEILCSVFFFSFSWWNLPLLQDDFDTGSISIMTAHFEAVIT